MALADILLLSSEKSKKQDITEERIKAVVPMLRQYIAYWREYPDMFVEFLCGDNPKNFQLYFYQRCFLRAAFRHRKIYATFPRGYSKSFLSFLALELKCILYPGSHLFVTTGGKEQAATIAKEKTDLLCELIPGLRNEIDFSRGQSKSSKDDVSLVFKNGSKLDVMAARQSSRGRRSNGGLIDEVILVDADTLNSVIIPTMVIDRRLSDGSRHRNELLNRSQIYITTAGWKSSFAYDKMIELLVQMVTEPDEAFVMGGTWRVPVIEELQPRSFIQDMKLSGTYDEGTFQREYESKWSGSAENAFFSADLFDKYRQLLQPEYEYSLRSSKNAYYVIGIDVGRIKCPSEAIVIKCTPQSQGSALKTIVNLYTYDAEDFEVQAIHFKKLFYKYHARALVIDANGLGAGLIDFMTKAQIDPETGDTLPAFGVAGGTSDEFNEQYKKVRGENIENNAMYLVKANAPINTEAHTYVQTQLSSGKLRFLIDENQAKVKLMATKAGQEMGAEKRAERLMPFQLTTILRSQMLNLVEENEGINIILKQTTKTIAKDKFSALEYGLYYIKQEEENKKRRKNVGIGKLLLFS